MNLRRVAVTTLVLGLLAGTAAAFAVTEALKLERAPVKKPRFTKVFSPTCGCATSTATLSFDLREPDRLDLTIVSEETPIRTLAEGLDADSGQVQVEWDGRDDSGAVVPDGVYQLRVDASKAGRTIVFPTSTEVDTEPPEVDVVEAGPTAFSPDGDGRRDRVSIMYETSETSRPILLVDGDVVREGRIREKLQRRVSWNGETASGVAPIGVHTVSLQVGDRAGNLTTLDDVLSVELRYVGIVPAHMVTRPGTRIRFRIVSDAASVSWRIRRPAGSIVRADAVATSGPVTVRLPAALRPGRYVLEAAANGHGDRAVIRVVRRRG